MHVSRRYWANATIAAALAALSIVTARPVLLLGAAGLGAWLIARQYGFVRSATAVDDRLTVDLRPSRTEVVVDEPAHATLTARVTGSAPLDVSITAPEPLAGRATSEDDRSVSITRSDQEVTTLFEASFPTAGTFRFPQPAVTLSDPFGLFEETTRRGPAPSITVEPRAPREIHVGRGGDRLAAAYGEHATDRGGSGLTVAEIRKYVAGDAANRIDWKATARLGRPYVREFETETDRRTVLVFDHRGTMAVGREGETMLDYAREVALSFVDSARELSDPLGLYAVGDGGLTVRLRPSTEPANYSTIRRTLHDFEPTRSEGEPSIGGRGSAVSPAAAHTAAVRLKGDDAAFGTTLHPYFRAGERYVQRIDGDPLFETVRTEVNRLRGSVWTILVTDDSARRHVRETVKLAARNDDRILVFLTPRVLFEPGGLADLEEAYRRYVSFEEFRRKLDRHPHVTAFEVGPGDRLNALLGAQRRRRARS
ncbi:DUF58 domain-containing protein [Halegenticoccus tardaugens]|uniref:DUF58 domain-containing protein n=1 Tax=Halegenticoccus tardaugens TaxID=2071624 RepID=UPI00100BD7F8|nr:DUF58 domain-containing protein [Halegenticoccus tardaugens]